MFYLCMAFYVFIELYILQLAKRLFLESSKLYTNTNLSFKNCAQIAAYAQLNRRINLVMMSLGEHKA